VHVFGDLLGSVAAIVAAVVIALTGWMPIDPLLSLAVAGLVLRSAWGLVRTSSHILLEGAPDWLDAGTVRAEMMAAISGVTDVHHIHTWMITAERPMMTLHVEVEPSADHQAMLAAIRAHIRERVGIEHATIQIETAGCLDEQAAETAAGASHAHARGHLLLFPHQHVQQIAGADDVLALGDGHRFAPFVDPDEGGLYRGRTGADQDDEAPRSGRSRSPAGS
jgi:cobalt-zinc-cadmium efflux system protein